MFAEDIAYEAEQPRDVAMDQAGAPDDNEPITAHDAWVIIEAYFQENNLVSQQIQSFNNFINNRLQARACHLTAACPDQCRALHGRAYALSPLELPLLAVLSSWLDYGTCSSALA